MVGTVFQNKGVGKTQSNRISLLVTPVRSCWFVLVLIDVDVILVVRALQSKLFQAGRTLWRDDFGAKILGGLRGRGAKQFFTCVVMMVCVCGEEGGGCGYHSRVSFA